MAVPAFGGGFQETALDVEAAGRQSRQMPGLPMGLFTSAVERTKERSGKHDRGRTPTHNGEVQRSLGPAKRLVPSCAQVSAAAACSATVALTCEAVSASMLSDTTCHFPLRFRIWRVEKSKSRHRGFSSAPPGKTMCQVSMKHFLIQK